MKNDEKYALNGEYTERHKIIERMENEMKQTIFEQLGGTYREENGSLVPDVELPEQKPIGKYGRMHLDYLKQHRRGRYSALLGEGRLGTYLADVDEQAHEMLSSLTAELAWADGTLCRYFSEDPTMNNRKQQVKVICCFFYRLSLPFCTSTE